MSEYLDSVVSWEMWRRQPLERDCQHISMIMLYSCFSAKICLPHLSYDIILRFARIFPPKRYSV